MNVAEPIRVIPMLPTELDGQNVTWQPWELAPVMTHIDNGCDICDHPGPMSTAEGRTAERRRYFAVRCRRCQQTRVITRVPTDSWTGRLVYVWESPAQAIGVDL